ncbi:MAG: lytic transglycosylase domain-containing protein [Desulfobacterales bacterium]|nr:lytic transglycosylase domain-containing protein [Desulfobacterales bacterium]
MGIDLYGIIGGQPGLYTNKSVFPATGYERNSAATLSSPSSAAGSPGPFHQLLEERLNSQTLRTINQHTTPSRLSGPELFALSQRIKLQLTDSLLRAFAEDESDNSDSSPMMSNPYDMFPQTMTGPISPSTIRQEPSENHTPAPHDLSGIIDRAAAAYNMDPDLITGVIHAESGFDPNALSPKGAMGLMQLMPQTANELGVADPFDPVENIMGGTRYLKRLMDRYQGDMSLALAAYNWGMGNLESRGDRLPAETKHYVRKITDFYQERKTAAA